MRALFTVALTIAVVAVATPAIAVVSVDRAETQTRGAVDRVVDAARSLAAGNDALADENLAARRVVAFDLPTGGFASAPIESLQITTPRRGLITGTERKSARDDEIAATRITWRVQGSQRHVRQVDGIRIRPASDERMHFANGGRQAIVLRLVSRDGRRVVAVSLR